MSKEYICPIYIAPSDPSYDGCLASDNLAEHDVSNMVGSFLDRVKRLIADGLHLDPGLYIIMNYPGEIGEYRAQLFTVDDNGDVTPGTGSQSSSGILTTWPPKKR